MISWNNFDRLAAGKKLAALKRVDLVEAMSGENGAKRVAEYSAPMACGLTYSYAAKAVDEDVLSALEDLASEAAQEIEVVVEDDELPASGQVEKEE